MDIKSEWIILHRLAILADIEPVLYDCCIGSCIAYLGRYEHHEQCPFCKEARYNSKRKPRRVFMYLPLIPRLKAYFNNPEVIQQLSYRHQYEHEPGRIHDVFDGSHYRGLLQKNVIIDGVEQPYKYFAGKRDIAFAVASDGYLLFNRRRRGPSATPILVQIFNLPPQVRTHIGRVPCLGIIPGPRPPKDMASFMVPLDDERVQLAYGVPTFDAIDQACFNLHAYAIQKHGDMVAIERVLGIKGHNGLCPCRSCKILGVRDITNHANTYYVPLTTPDVEHQTRPSVDPRALPLRTQQDFDAVLQQIKTITGKTKRDNFQKKHGIREEPALRRVGSLDSATSYPWEWMHLFCENAAPNLVELWTGKFKGLDAGMEDYELDPKVWEQIGIETQNAVQDIPAAFVRVLGNIAKDRSMFTAESWGFWLMYVAPIVLHGRFTKDKYYKHLCALSKIMKKTLKFEITEREINDLEDDIIDWVEKYEK
jgi:hypothetical protein